MKVKIAVDGASKGNPGPAGIGIVISDEDGKTLKEISENIGVQTNNVAEYTAMVRGLAEALDMGATEADIQTDSELMAHQINGRYRVKNEGILPHFQEANRLLRRFKRATVTHVLRGKNAHADKLASSAAAPGKVAPQPSLLMEETPAPKKAAKPASAPAPTPTPPISAEQPETTKIMRLPVRTSSRAQLIDITRQVQDLVRCSGVKDGLCTVYVPHTTAGVTINENADPDVVTDIIDTLERLVPRSQSYKHVEGNSDAHVKASMMGFSINVLVEGGRLVLGTWQGIYFCEFDGPRSRQVLVRVS